MEHTGFSVGSLGPYIGRGALYIPQVGRGSRGRLPWIARSASRGMSNSIAGIQRVLSG
jgi:hypothetical protein